ncbi:hypothetical protein X975_05337, partial [Stegodyphus mimosarum]
MWLISDNFVFQSKYLYFSVMFSDEASFLLSGIVNRHNVRIWDLKTPMNTMRHKGIPQRLMYSVD